MNSCSGTTTAILLARFCFKNTHSLRKFACLHPFLPISIVFVRFHTMDSWKTHIFRVERHLPLISLDSGALCDAQRWCQIIFSCGVVISSSGLMKTNIFHWKHHLGLIPCDSEPRCDAERWCWFIFSPPVHHRVPWYVPKTQLAPKLSVWYESRTIQNFNPMFFVSIPIPMGMRIFLN